MTLALDRAAHFWRVQKGQRDRHADMVRDRATRGVLALFCAKCGHTHRTLHATTCTAAHPDADHFDGEVCGNTSLTELFATST